MTELLNCPFCGGKRIRIKQSVGKWWVHCKDCFADGPICDTEAEAIVLWSRRPAPDVERVALAIKADMAQQFNAQPLPGPSDPTDWTATGGELDLEQVARAAIAAMGGGDGERCGTCRFWQLSDYAKANSMELGVHGLGCDGSVSNCKRNAPNANPTKHERTLWGDASWPITRKDDWCSEWRKR